MPQNRLGWVGGVIAKKGGRSGRQTECVAYDTESLHGHPSIWVELSGSHVERLKDAHHEIVKGKRNVQIRKKKKQENKKKGRSEGNRPIHTVLIGWQGSTDTIPWSTFDFKIGTLFKKSETKVSLKKQEVILVTLGSTQ